jgi:hypothetical protein
MRGLSPIAATIDEDWCGNLWVPVSNQGAVPLELHRDEALCTAVFFKTASKPTTASVHALRAPAEDHIGMDTAMERSHAEAAAERERKRMRLAMSLAPLLFIILAAAVWALNRYNLGDSEVNNIGVFAATVTSIWVPLSVLYYQRSSS